MIRIQNIYILSFAAVIAMLGLFTACDEVADGDRYITVERQQPVTPSDSDSTVSLPEMRRVLIEDFTGQRCTNCPNAANEITKIQEAYGADTVIAVSIHGGAMAFAGNAKNIGLKNDLGDEYNDHWSVNSWPKGMVNRSGVLKDYEDWFTLVNAELQREAPLRLSVGANASEGLNTTTTIEALDDVAGYLQLWLTESNIIALQSMPDLSTNREYVHNHVLRAAINGSWGEAVTLTKGQTATLTHTLTLDPAWNVENLSVVAFVYNDQGVCQVTETHVTH